MPEPTKAWDGRERRRRKEPDSERRQHWLYRWNTLLDQIIEKRFAIGAIAFAVFLILAVQSYAIINTNVQAGRGIRETRRIAERLESCTIPDGECYKKLQTSGQGGLTRLVTYWDCALLTAPFPERNQTELNDCRRRAQIPTSDQVNVGTATTVTR